MEKPANLNDTSLEALSKIYRLYDDYINSFSLACTKYCSDCCTTALTLTSLEGLMIYKFLDPATRETVFEKLLACSNMNRFRPAMTTNQYARLCSEHREPPEENYPEEPDRCPFLENNACSIYPVRPFGCRCMISDHPCHRTGNASMDDFTLTVNTMFLQIIEHLDQKGFSGNLIDVMLRISAKQDKKIPADCSTVANHPITVLMIPPEHQRKVSPLLTTLNHIMKQAGR
ncbi:MAG: YkgJ family cysteine cluster protein [Desulfosalsimonas sp.]